MTDAIERYLADQVSGGAITSRHTVSAYRSDLRRLEAFLGVGSRMFAWERLTAELVRGWVESLNGRERATTIARRVASARSFVSWRASRGTLPDIAPLAGLIAPRIERSTPKGLDDLEVDALLSAASDRPGFASLRDLAMMAFLTETGIRVSELVALDLIDVDLGQRILWVRGRRQRARQAALGRRSAAALRDYLDARRLVGRGQGVPALFVNQSGGRLTRQGAWLRFKSLAKAANIEGAVPRGLRASFAARMYAEGAAPPAVRSRLGVATLESARRYQPAVA